MTVYVVTVSLRLNAVFAKWSDADVHVRKLYEVNGDAIFVKIEEIEVRGA